MELFPGWVPSIPRPPGPDRIEAMRRDLPLIVTGWPLATQSLITFAVDLGLAFASGQVTEAAFRRALACSPDRSQ